MAVSESGRRQKAMRVGVGHLYATGPDVARDAVVQVGLIRLSARPASERFEWRFSAGRKLGRRVRLRSGLHDADLEGKPPWRDSGLPTTQSAFAGLDILFVLSEDMEVDWFRSVLGGRRDSPIIVDLVHLGRTLLPEAPWHAIDALRASMAGEPAGDHDRSPMSRDLAAGVGLLRRLLEVLLLVPEGAEEGTGHLLFSLLDRAAKANEGAEDIRTLCQVARAADRIHWPEPAEPFPRPIPLKTETLTRADVMRWVKAVGESPRQPGAQIPPGEERRVLSAKTVAAAFDRLQTMRPELRVRPAQRRYAEFCVGAVNDGGVYAVEAGTGTGKTLGYLIPACELVRANPGSKVLIATATKNLQDQIAGEELPRLTQSGGLYHGLRTAVLKGSGNYLCDQALVDRYEEIFGPSVSGADRMLAWVGLVILLVRCGGETDRISRGVRDRLPALGDLLEEMNAGSACTPEQCQLAGSCTLSAVRARAREADIIVTNQHKLPFVGELLQTKAALCVVDEADEFPDNLRSATELRLSDFGIRRRILQRIGGSRRRRGYADVLRAAFQAERKRAPDERAQKVLDTCLDAAERLAADCEMLDVVLRRVGEGVGATPEGGIRRWQELEEPDAGDRLTASLLELAEHLAGLRASFERILKSGRYREGEGAAGATRRGAALQSERMRVDQYRQVVGETEATARGLTMGYQEAGFVHTFRSNGRDWEAIRSSMDLSRQFETVLPYHTTLFTSATLYVNRSLDLFIEELGLQGGLDGSLCIPSIFNYRENVLGAVTGFLPMFRFGDREAGERWVKGVAATVSALTVAADGRALVLFTSRAEMRAVFDRVAPVLRRHDIDPIVQDGSSLAEINTFRSYEHSVLFGVDRFWKGVDFPGSTLSLVIVVRLPNPALGDPLIRHRREQLGEDVFWETYYHPYTRLKLKQGFGRLVRTETDRGAFVVLDRRIVDDWRMSTLQEELPVPLEVFPAWRSERNDGDLLDLVRQALDRAGLREQFEERGVDVYGV